MRKKRRKKSTNTIVITAVIGALIAAILVVTGIVILKGKHGKPPETSQRPETVTVTRSVVAGEELLIKGCLFDLGIQKDQVRSTGRTFDVTVAKAVDPSRIDRAFSRLSDVEGVEVSRKTPERVSLIINEKQWDVFFHVLKPPVGKAVKVAIIIDDMGTDMEVARKLAAIDADLTFSVLPNERHSREVAQYLHKRGREVLLHLPMEGSGKNPGIGAIYHDTDPAQAQQILRESLEKVPMADGVNNHMGSVVTQDEVLMKAIFSVLKEHGLFFVDSVTTGNSVCRAVAAGESLPFQARDVFLDNDQTYSYITGQIDDLVAAARRRGEAIGICHPHAGTVSTLIREVPLLREKGVEVVPVSALVEGRG